MSEQLKMGLRPKRKPKYRASDQQDPDNPTYTRPNYLKLSTTPHTQELVSPSVVLNLNAKLLVKFINKANKCMRDIRLTKVEPEKQPNKKESLPKEKIAAEHVENAKKLPQSSKPPKPQSQKKSKELYNFKEIHQNSELIKNLSQQQVIKGVQNLQNLSGLINGKSIYSGLLSNQLTQLQSLYPNLKDLNYQTLTQNPNPNLFEFEQQQAPKPAAKVQQSTKPQPSPARQQNPKPKSQPKREIKEPEPEKKAFKRSSYHVAIAYHIYLKGLSEKGITSGNQIDPTYKARLIKEQAGMVNDDEE